MRTKTNTSRFASITSTSTAAVPPHLLIFIPRARMAALCDPPLQNSASVPQRTAFPRGSPSFRDHD